MEGWYLILVSISIALLLKAFYDLLSPSSSDPNHKKAKNPLPPGPPTFPIVGNFLWLRKSSELEPILRSLHSKLGAMVTLRIGPRPAIFVADRSLAHQALVQNGAVFANRPRAGATSKILSSNQHNISSNSYGTTWRLLRRNLTSEILHPSRVKSYSHVRKWVLQILLTRLDSDSSDKKPVRVVDHFDYAMFCLLALMCFGDKLDEKQIKELERVERNILLNAIKYNILNFFPRATKILMRKKWEEFLKMRKEEEEVIIPLIRARERVLKGEGKRSEECVLSYVDTLFNLELLDEKRKLNDGELVSLCHEFFIGGTGTSTALQWIMANLVKYPRVQEKLFAEMREVVGAVDRLEEVREEELSKMQYLKAVVLEGLRRHPPGHLLLPHAVSEDVVLGDYLVPKDGSVNFMVADMGWDPAVWEDPMEFRPERFVGKEDEFDITGSKGIKMMPFGAGKRMCPGYSLAMLHLQYFVANLVWRFEWKEVEGVGVDLSEKQEFTTVMKFPLQAQLIPREKRN